MNEEETSKRRIKRGNVVQEIQQVESKFVQSMSVLLDSFLTPLQTMSNKKTSPGIGEICTNTARLIDDITVIRNYNGFILKDIENRIQMSGHPGDVSLGVPFLQIADFLKTYTDYVTHYTKTQATLAKYTRDTSVQSVLNGLKPSGESRDIKSFLIMPVQHIPRMFLLLQDLLKTTLPSQPDYSDLVRATDRISAIAAYIETSQHVAAAQSKVVEIAQCFKSHKTYSNRIVAPSRTFVQEAPMEVRVGSALGEQLHVFLFNDLLLIARPGKPDRKKGPTYRFLREIFLSDVNAVKRTEHHSQPAVSLFLDEGMDVLFLLPGSGTREQWFEAIVDLISKMQQKEQTTVQNRLQAESASASSVASSSASSSSSSSASSSSSGAASSSAPPHVPLLAFPNQNKAKPKRSKFGFRAARSSKKRESHTGVVTSIEAVYQEGDAEAMRAPSEGSLPPLLELPSPRSRAKKKPLRRYISDFFARPSHHHQETLSASASGHATPRGSAHRITGTTSSTAVGSLGVQPSPSLSASSSQSSPARESRRPHAATYSDTASSSKKNMLKGVDRSSSSSSSSSEE